MSDSHPHVIMLMADQLRRDVLGCYGGPFGASPAIDSLADESVLFRSHAVNCPLCVPSRISMVTGAWPHVNGAIVNGWDEPERPYGRCRDVPTMYESLAEAGYCVEHVGVDHLRCEPPLAGRHERIRFRANPGEFMQQLRRDGMAVDTSICRSPTMDYVDGQPVMRMYSNANTVRWPHPPERFLDSWIADRIIEVIESHDASRPLALMGRFWSPHPPLSCPEPYFSMYDPAQLELPETVGQWCPGQSPIHLVNLPGHVSASLGMDGWRKAWSAYLGMVRLLDDCIGRVVAALRDRGYWDDALFVFTCDHGEMLGSHRMYQKMCMYEESIRVPMMVKPPSYFAPGPQDRALTARTQLTQHLDLAATICDYAGAEVPSASQGESFRPIVDDPGAP
ncbi:MAG: sulfatase family protein, partial [Planctomycetota bacterium]